MYRLRLSLAFAGLLLCLTMSVQAVEHLVPVTSEKLITEVKETKAKLVVVNVWATWCVPCRLEFPHFVKFREAYRDKGVEVYFVSADFEDALDAARTFLDERGVTWKNFLMNESEQTFINTLNKDWSGALPATFVFDAEGKLLTFWESEVTFEQLEERVTPHLD